MSDTAVGLCGLGALFVLFILRMPVGLSMLITGFLGTVAIRGWNHALPSLSSETFAIASFYQLSIIPMFVLMGNVAGASGMGRDLYDAAYAWVGHIRGGLASATVVVCTILAAMVGTGMLGWAFERVIIMPVYGQHLKQILITTGGLIVAEQLIHVFWGGDQKPMPLPTALRGAITIGDVAIEKFRLLALAIGLVVFLAMLLVLNRTKLGLLIRAGVENTEMVEALGYRIRRLFVAVFVAGSALAGLGGTLWALYRETLTAGIGGEVIVLVFIVIIIGGLGSVGGCFLGSILVAQMANYTGYLAPKVALASNILLMVIILMWRPMGLYPVAKR